MRSCSSSEQERDCKNCGQSLELSYCPLCGQRDLDFKRDWKGLVGEYASSFLNLDGKILRGLVDISFRPGLMTQKFLEGKRASQIPPLRFYLFASLAFFLWVTMQESVSFDDFAVEKPLIQEEPIDADTDHPAWVQTLEEKMRNPESLRATFTTWMPRVFLLGVPLLAISTRLLFFKRSFVYLEHIVISMHFQTFILLWLLLIGLLTDLIGILHHSTGELFWIVSIWWIQVYVVIALRRVFELSWLKAVGSSVVLQFVSFLFFIAGIILLSFLTIWLA